MKYTGVDWHKRYSVCYTVNQEGQRVKEQRIEGNRPELFARYFDELDGPHEVVHEACWNWAKLHEILEQMQGMEQVVLAHPHKTRLIADAQIKTDRLDAKALATLLRGNLVARVHVPPRDARQRKLLLRQRLQLARLRTLVRNRIHVIVDRQHHLKLPQCSDLFGVKGLSALRQAILSEQDRQLLDGELALHDLMQSQIKALEKRIEKDNKENSMTRRLQSMPGLGKILAAVMASEIDTIERFPSTEKLCAYAGLVPTTHASGGKVSHGKLLPWCNKWLRWALVEAAWVAIGCSPYFGDLYKQHRARGKKANTAIMIVARRMCQIAWSMLKKDRDFSPYQPDVKTLPGRSHQGLKVA
jgi:transposase